MDTIRINTEENTELNFNLNMGENALSGLNSNIGNPETAYEEPMDDPDELRLKMITNEQKKRVGGINDLDEFRNSPINSGRNTPEIINHFSEERRSSVDIREQIQPQVINPERLSANSERSSDYRKIPSNQNNYYNDDRSLSSRSEHLIDHSVDPEELKKRAVEERRIKLRLLNKIERYADKGIPAAGVFTINTPLEDLEMEVERLESKNDMDNSVKGYKDGMMFCTGIMELASKYFGVGKIDGYSEQLYSDLYTEPYRYDQVLEDLYDKHRDRPKMAPELKLMMMMGGGLFMYHMSNVMMPKPQFVPPQQQQQFVPPQQQQFVPPQQQQFVPPQQQQQPDPVLLEKMRREQMKEMKNQEEPKVIRKTMSGPQGVDDILRQFEKSNPQPKDVETESYVSGDFDETASMSASEVATGKPRRRRKKQVPTFKLDM
jgi:hypothetical protein